MIDNIYIVWLNKKANKVLISKETVELCWKASGTLLYQHWTSLQYIQQPQGDMSCCGGNVAHGFQI